MGKHIKAGPPPPRGPRSRYTEPGVVHDFSGPGTDDHVDVAVQQALDRHFSVGPQRGRSEQAVRRYGQYKSARAFAKSAAKHTKTARNVAGRAAKFATQAEKAGLWDSLTRVISNPLGPHGPDDPAMFRLGDL